MKNQGISLITLIITIIVIIILAAIVIFTGLRTPDSAQFSSFTNDVDSVYTAMIDKFSDLKVSHAIAGNYRTNEQIYIQLATGDDPGQYAVMGTDNVKTASDDIPTGSTKCQNIQVGTTVGTNGVVTSGITHSYTGTKTGAISTQHKLGITLPMVRQTTESWYVTEDGRIFNSTGFYYNGNTYYNASYYTDGIQMNTVHKTARAEAICNQMYSSSPAAGKTSAFIVALTAND
jgi:type II secretory pathway pseudopilin PulG